MRKINKANPIPVYKRTPIPGILDLQPTVPGINLVTVSNYAIEGVSDHLGHLGCINERQIKLQKCQQQ